MRERLPGEQSDAEDESAQADHGGDRRQVDALEAVSGEREQEQRGKDDEQHHGDGDEEGVDAPEDVVVRRETECAGVDSEVAGERALPAVSEVVGERRDQRHRRDDGDDEACDTASLAADQRGVGLGLRGLRHGYQTFISRSASGTPPSSVTSQVSCM